LEVLFGAPQCIAGFAFEAQDEAGENPQATLAEETSGANVGCGGAAAPSAPEKLVIARFDSKEHFVGTEGEKGVSSCFGDVGGTRIEHESGTDVGGLGRGETREPNRI